MKNLKKSRFIFCAILTVKHRPNNYRKDKSYAAEDIDQLYVRKSPNTGLFDVMLIINGWKGQKHQKLLSLTALSKAQFLEQEIEHYLEIENRKIPESNV